MIVIYVVNVSNCQKLEQTDSQNQIVL